MAPGLSPEMMSEIETGFSDAKATRYFSAVGAIMMLYDHLLTFDDEVGLVWNARPSFAKYAFLLNRYLVAACVVGAAFYMNNYSGPPLSDLSCRRFFGASSLLAVGSIAIANTLVLLRVVSLWDRNKRVALLLTFGMISCTALTYTFLSMALTTILPDFSYSHIIRICAVHNKPSTLSAAWASPMAFELLVLIAVAWNAIDRPRSAGTNLTRALHRDGFAFFTSLTLLRLFNFIMAIVARPTLIMVGSYFVWSMNTLVLNRSLLNIQKAAMSLRSMGNGHNRNASSYSLTTTSSNTSNKLRPCSSKDALRAGSRVESVNDSITGLGPLMTVTSPTSPFGENVVTFDDVPELRNEEIVEIELVEKNVKLVRVPGR